MRRIAMKKLIIILSVFFLIITSCDTTDPKPPEEKPPGYQEDIPWPSLADSPWPMEHGNPQSTGRSVSGSLLYYDTLWCKSFEGPISVQNFTSVIIDEDSTIYFGSSFENSSSGQVSYLYAMTINGDIKWRYKFEVPQISTTPLIGADGTIYVASRENYLYAFYPNAEVKWKFDAHSPIYYMALNIDKEGVLYFVSSENILFAVNPDGSKKWDLYFDEGFASTSMNGLSISPNGDVLYVPGLSKTLYAISIEGTLEWSFDNGGGISMIPMVESNGNILFSTTCNYFFTCETEKIVCLDPEGNIYWEQDEDGSSILPVIDEFGSSYFRNTNGILSFSYEGKLNWNSTLNFSETPLVIDRDNNIYANYQDQVVKINYSNGTIINTVHASLYSNATPALGYNLLIVPSVTESKKICVIK
jgi:outer membrane protein assembly factor BamB